METARPTAEPTNAELKDLFVEQIARLGAKVDAATQSQATAIAELNVRVTEVNGKVSEQGRKLLEFDRRLTANERDTKRLKEEHDGLQGDLLREVGVLALKTKNLEAETKAQTALLKLADSYWQKAKAWWKWGKFALGGLLFAFDVPKAWESWRVLWHALREVLR